MLDTCLYVHDLQAHPLCFIFMSLTRAAAQAHRPLLLEALLREADSAAGAAGNATAGAGAEEGELEEGEAMEEGEAAEDGEAMDEGHAHTGQSAPLR